MKAQEKGQEKGRLIKNRQSSDQMASKIDTTVLFIEKKKEDDEEDEMPTKQSCRPLSISDKLAESLVYFRNHRWPEARTDFPVEPWMRSIDKFYPNAKDGPLLVDEPKLHSHIVMCERKKRVLEKHGYRYIMLTQDKTLEVAKEELSKWRGPTS